MSYDISLQDAGGVVQVQRHTEGGTYQVGGTTDADLNVTYNYDRVYAGRTVHPRDLHGRRAGDTIAELEHGVATLGTDRAADYWQATDGNAGAVLDLLLAWARQHPDAIWQVDG